MHVLIQILEELKEQEYTEKWAFELAYLYHQAGRSEECINACDELILWFGDGPYVEKALELKMLYQPLNRAQEDKYRQFKQRKDGIVEVRPEDYLESGEIIKEPVQIKPVTTNAEKFNTVNLQEELARSMQQIMNATEKEEVADTMQGIKKIVEEIPYLQLPQDEEAQKERFADIPTDEEIDGSLKINFQEMLGEDYDGQMRMVVPEKSALEAQIVDRVQTYIAPKIFGGTGIGPVGGMGVDEPADAYQLVNSRLKQIGEDFLIESDVKYKCLQES